MKKLITLSIILACTTGCIYGPGGDDDLDQPLYSQYEPITLSRQMLGESLQTLPAREVTNAGKIYVFNQLLIVNEFQEGFHIYDNQNPESPQPIGFIQVLGATDLAIRNNVIMSHHAVDLISFSYDDQTHEITLLKRLENVFPELISPDGFPAGFYEIPQNHVVVGYQLKDN